MVKEPGGEERGGPKNTGWREENMAPSFAAAAECGAPQVQISAAPHACHSTEEKSSADGLSWLHTVQHPCVFGAARISLHLPPPASARVQQPLTNSNRTEPNQIKSNQTSSDSPSSSPICSSFHVQQSSINLIHSPAESQCPVLDRCPGSDHHHSSSSPLLLSCVAVLQLLPAAAAERLFVRLFIQDRDRPMELLVGSERRRGDQPATPPGWRMRLFRRGVSAGQWTSKWGHGDLLWPLKQWLVVQIHLIYDNVLLMAFS